MVAYTVLPEEADPTRESPAEVWVMNVATENLTRLARDADLLVPPVFTDGGSSLLYRRSQGSTQEIVRVQLDDLTREVVHSEQTSFGVFPIGLRGASLLFARLSTEGTDVFAVEPGVEPEFLLHASDDIARDWRVSPDGSALSFLAPINQTERVVYRAQIVSLESLESLDIARPTSEATAGTEQYGPVWTPDGAAVTIGQEAFTSESEPAVVLGLDGSRFELTTPTYGFDVPIAWSTDGRYLAVRSFDGRNSVQPGLQRMVIVDREGARFEVDVPSEVIFLGWYAGA
jgi:Tol biopolymer transport system component